MSIRYAILGILSYGAYTGYDLKKIMNESAVMYWSGNNNQIYKTLNGLKSNGFVESEVIHQEEGPTKKTYVITQSGREELAEWVVRPQEAESVKNIFLVQLAWAKEVEDNLLTAFTEQYEEQVRRQLWLVEEEYRRKKFIPERTKKEKFLWQMIYENLSGYWRRELEWSLKLKEKIMKGEWEV